MSYESDDKMVSHPDHYNSGKYEVIDIIEEFTKNLSGLEAVCTGNAIKYILRWKKKGGYQDLEKAMWYIQHMLDKHEEAEHKPLNKDDDISKYAMRSCITCDVWKTDPCPTCVKILSALADKEESELSVKTHTNTAGVTVPDSQPWEKSGDKDDPCPCYAKHCIHVESCCGCPEYDEWIKRQRDMREKK